MSELQIWRCLDHLQFTVWSRGHLPYAYFLISSDHTLLLPHLVLLLSSQSFSLTLTTTWQAGWLPRSKELGSNPQTCPSTTQVPFSLQLFLNSGVKDCQVHLLADLSFHEISIIHCCSETYLSCFFHLAQLVLQFLFLLEPVPFWPRAPRVCPNNSSQFHVASAYLIVELFRAHFASI